MERRVNVLNIRGNQISDEIVLIDLNCLLKNGQLPELVPNSELKDIITKVKQTMRSSSELAMQQSDASF